MIAAHRWCCVLVLAVVTLTGSAISERERNFPDLYQFPYHGLGDPLLSFHSPFEPDDDGDPVAGWVQLGSAMVTSNPSGREIVRLTTTAQANQGLFYAYTRTRTSDFNGWFDVQINTAPDSHEPADGMALFFTSNRPVVGSAMGMSHTQPALGLVIDTFSNSRTRMTPYLYAYVSDGHRSWNPDTDGADTELTKGCHIELNKHTRIYVRFVDRKLDVGVSYTPHVPDRWHSCFTVDHVDLPFNDGGYLAFAGETGHFFAAHDVLGASFVAEHAHNRRPEEETYSRDSREAHERLERERREREERERREHEHHEYNEYHNRAAAEQREREERERREREERERREREHHEYIEHHDYNDYHSRAATEQREREERERREREERERRDRGNPHAGSEASISLAKNLDKQVADVFESLSEHMRGYSDRDAEDTRQRLNGVRDMTSHILHEVSRQRSELQKVISSLTHLKETASGLSYETGKFRTHLQSMQKSMKVLRDRTRDFSSSNSAILGHLETQPHVLASKSGAKKGDSAFYILFGVLQVMLVAIVVFSNKIAMASRKGGRMV